MVTDRRKPGSIYTEIKHIIVIVIIKKKKSHLNTEDLGHIYNVAVNN